MTSNTVHTEHTTTILKENYATVNIHLIAGKLPLDNCYEFRQWVPFLLSQTCEILRQLLKRLTK